MRQTPRFSLIAVLAICAGCKSPDRGEGPWNTGVKAGAVPEAAEVEKNLVADVEAYVAEKMPWFPLDRMGEPLFSMRAESAAKRKWPGDIRVEYRGKFQLSDREINEWWDILMAVAKQHGIPGFDDDRLNPLVDADPATRAKEFRALLSEDLGREIKASDPGLVWATFVSASVDYIQLTSIGFGVSRQP